MAEQEKSYFDKLFELDEAIRFNHNIPTGSSYNLRVNPEVELEKYRTRLTQMTLPQRFGYYKSQMKDVPVKSDVEVEEPPFEPETENTRSADPNHKVRNIFD